MPAGLIHGLNRFKPAGDFYLPTLQPNGAFQEQGAARHQGTSCPFIFFFCRSTAQMKGSNRVQEGTSDFVVDEVSQLRRMG